jgi:hypothetical protein
VADTVFKLQPNTEAYKEGKSLHVSAVMSGDALMSRTLGLRTWPGRFGSAGGGCEREPVAAAERL